VIAALLLLAAFAEPNAGAVVPSDSVWQTDFDKATKLARTQKKRLFVYVYDKY
jgi:hypothetical protein